jgi:hypothetical protein
MQRAQPGATLTGKAAPATNIVASWAMIAAGVFLIAKTLLSLPAQLPCELRSYAISRVIARLLPKHGT